MWTWLCSATQQSELWLTWAAFMLETNQNSSSGGGAVIRCLSAPQRTSGRAADTHVALCKPLGRRHRCHCHGYVSDEMGSPPPLHGSRWSWAFFTVRRPDSTSSTGGGLICMRDGGTHYQSSWNREALHLLTKHSRVISQTVLPPQRVLQSESAIKKRIINSRARHRCQRIRARSPSAGSCRRCLGLDATVSSYLWPVPDVWQTETRHTTAHDQECFIRLVAAHQTSLQTDAHALDKIMKWLVSVKRGSQAFSSTSTQPKHLWNSVEGLNISSFFLPSLP